MGTDPTSPPDRFSTPASWLPLIERIATAQHRVCEMVGVHPAVLDHDMDDHRHSAAGLLHQAPDIAAALIRADCSACSALHYLHRPTPTGAPE